MDSIWKALEMHARSVSIYKSLHVEGNSIYSPSLFHASACNIQLDFSNQRITPETLRLLIKLGEARQLRDKIQALMSGRMVNVSEKKPALHTALRATGYLPLWVVDHNIMDDIVAARKKIQVIVQAIRENHWFGFSGKPITDIVNIGIGGSDLGPRCAISALHDFIHRKLGFHFISDADPYAFEHTVTNLNPETTLFIISSKSFTTQEMSYCQIWCTALGGLPV